MKPSSLTVPSSGRLTLKKPLPLQLPKLVPIFEQVGVGRLNPGPEKLDESACALTVKVNPIIVNVKTTDLTE
ncbi:MAG: hypothetical protein QM527_07715 [Alphaproteobacteria bacterium]|nr:hypothetical protein [Alphaproteobacteria bacterium]